MFTLNISLFQQEFRWVKYTDVTFSGQATSKNQEKSDQPGEGSAGTNIIISAQDDEQTDVSDSMHVVGPIDGMADGIGNFYEEENGSDEKEMQSELLYVVNELD